jgi:membrane dipeptidase
MNADISTHLDIARKLHARKILIDTHCDTTQHLLNANWQITARHGTGHVDLPRMRDGGVAAMFFAVYAPRPSEPGQGIAAARRQINAIHAMIERHPDQLVSARTPLDITAAKNAGKIAILIAIEGGYLIEDSLDVLREYHDAGATYLTLTHSFHTTWADSSGVHADLTPLHNGLAPFGKDVVRELNALGMMVDVSHVSDKTFWDTLELSTAPIIATHSSCRSVSPHRRNMSDEMIKALADADGVIQINFASAFIDPDFPPVDIEALTAWRADKTLPKPDFLAHPTPLDVLVDHFDHALQLVGPDHVGIGTDFDGVPTLPEGMQDCSMLPSLTAGLLARGYQEDDLAKMLGENVLRVMNAVQSPGN